jgi:methionine synthase I (cobalamin-dependent)
MSTFDDRENAFENKFAHDEEMKFKARSPGTNNCSAFGLQSFWENQVRDWILADGATGTNLFEMGLESGDAPELWNETHPGNITKLYQMAVDAGSDLFLTNSFGGNSARLKLHNAGHRARELSRISAELGREVADKAGRTVIVAGSVGPTGEIMEPVGSLSHADAVEIFHEQAQGLKEGGADVLWLETISAPEEYRAAAEAFAKVDLPWVGTMSFDTAGRTMMGVTSKAMVEMVQSLDHKPCRLWCKLRNWRCRYFAHRSGICRRKPCPSHCIQGQCRHSQICRWAHAMTAPPI